VEQERKKNYLEEEICCTLPMAEENKPVRVQRAAYISDDDGL